jgi:hypothetical protein
MITVAELKRAVGIAASNNTRNSDLQACADAAVEWIQGKTGRYFGEPRATTQIIDGDGVSDTIYVTGIPAESPALVIRTWGSNEWDVVDAEDYDVETSRVIMREEPWPYGRRNIKAEYTEGYASGQAPADVHGAVLAVAVAMWKEQHSGGVQSESIAGYSYSLRNPGDLPTYARQTINRYRRVRI